MIRIVYAFVASWNYGLVVLRDSASSPVNLGLSLGLVLLTLAHLIVLLQSPSRAKKVITYGYQYWRNPKFIETCPEPEICEHMKIFGLTAKTSCLIIGYGLLAFALLTSLLVIPASL